MENTTTVPLTSDELINEIARSIQTQISSLKPSETIESSERHYRLISEPHKVRRGQCSQALDGLREVGAGTLDEIVDEVIRLHPSYKTKFNLRESVRFHLHCLSREGFVEEVN